MPSAVRSLRTLRHLSVGRVAYLWCRTGLNQVPFGPGSNDERALHGNEHTDHRNQEGSQGKSIFNYSIVHLLSSMCVAACGCQ